MTRAELDREISRLDREGDREGVVVLMRKYGLFEDEEAVRQYLSNGEQTPMN